MPQQFFVFPVSLQRFGNIENFSKSLVPQQRPSTGIHHKNPVDRGIGLCFQKCLLKLQFCFGLFSARDIAEKPVSVEHSSVFMDRGGAILYPDPPSILSAEPVFHVKAALLLEEQLVALIHTAKIRRMNTSHAQLLPGAEFILGVTQHGFHFWTDVSGMSIDVRSPGNVRCVGQDSAKPFRIRSLSRAPRAWIR